MGLRIIANLEPQRGPCGVWGTVLDIPARRTHSPQVFPKLPRGSLCAVSCAQMLKKTDERGLRACRR
eukprot:7862252-Alexandrium_andersonii.AAC.1